MKANVLRTNLPSWECERRRVAFQRRTGFDIRSVSTTGLRSDLEILGRISHAFQFPDWAGTSVNSVIDTLSDLSWVESTRVGLLVEDPQGFFVENRCSFTKALTEIQFRWRYDKENLRIQSRVAERFICWINSPSSHLQLK